MKVLLLWIAGMIAMLGSCALAQEAGAAVPPPSVSDFGGAVASAADAAVSVSDLWWYLALVIGSGAIGYLFMLFRPTLLEWAKKLRIDFLFLQAEKLIPAISAKYVAGMTAAKADGVVTKQEFDNVIKECVAEFRERFPGIVRALGPVVIEGLIREFVKLLLPGDTAVQNAARPFSDSSQHPLPELQPVVRASTGEVFGSTTNAPA